MSEPIEPDADDVKLVTLARAARARNAAAEGAAVRDDTGRTYVATTVALTSVRLSAMQAAVVMAVASGASGLEAAAIVSTSDVIRDDDRDVVGDLSRDVPILLAGLDGCVRAVLRVGA